MKKYIFLLLVSIFLFSCGPHYLLDEKKEIPNQKWSYADSLTFTMEVSDTLQRYNFYLDMEHLTTYPFQNMYIRLHSIFPNGKRTTEQISLELMDKNGRWKGDCNSEDCDFRMPINEGTFFGQKGKYQFVIEQYMRKNPLEGVQSLALRIEEVASK